MMDIKDATNILSEFHIEVYSLPQSNDYLVWDDVFLTKRTYSEQELIELAKQLEIKELYDK